MMSKPVQDERQLAAPSRHWLAFPAALHVALTFIVFLIGRLGLLPGHFDGNGVGTSFASDGSRYHLEAIALVEALTNHGFGAWLKAPPQLHVKIYSLSYAAFAPLFGYNIIAAEPLNALYYLTTVYLVFAIGRKIFNRRAGLLSALIVALWPSFLLHSTQLLRDPLFIVLWLILILIISNYLIAVLPWRGGLMSALLAIAATVVLWIVRLDIWILIRASVILVTVFLVIRQIRDRKIYLGNSLGAISLLIAVMIVPQGSRVVLNEYESRGLGTVANKTLAPSGTIIRRRWTSIVKETGPGRSSIDKDIFFNGAADIFRYLPRAIEIGFFAPFPDTWFPAGIRAGSVKSWLTGLETMAMYVVELLACLTLWRNRRRLSVWLLCSIAAIGMLGLGLVVVNIGTLYRLRYPLLIILIIVASLSLTNLMSPKTSKRRVSEETGSPGLAAV